MHLGTVAEHIERIYRRAGSKKLWFVYLHHFPFVLHRFFFPWFVYRVKLDRYALKEGQKKRTALLTKLYWFIAAEGLVYNALKTVKKYFLSVLS